MIRACGSMKDRKKKSKMHCRLKIGYIELQLGTLINIIQITNFFFIESVEFWVAAQE